MCVKCSKNLKKVKHQSFQKLGFLGSCCQCLLRTSLDHPFYRISFTWCKTKMSVVRPVFNNCRPCPSLTLAKLFSCFNHLSTSEEQMYSVGLTQPFTPPHFLSLEWKINEVDETLSKGNVDFQFTASRILCNVCL